MDRRTFLRGLALGGAVIAGEMWIPGKKLISIPPPEKFERYTHRTYGITYVIPYEPMTDDQLDAIGRIYAQHLANSMRETKANLIARLLNDVYG